MSHSRSFLARREKVKNDSSTKSSKLIHIVNSLRLYPALPEESCLC